MRLRKLIGVVWDLLYIEGRRPDVGVRREHFVRTILKKELGYHITTTPELDRQLDFLVEIEGKQHPISVKTLEKIGVLKVAWDGHPSRDRAEEFVFNIPILFLTRSGRGFYLIDLDDIKQVRAELPFDDFWQTFEDRSGNPRGFGIKGRAVRGLMEIAEEKGNFVEVPFQEIAVDEKIKELYFNKWYNMLLEIAEPFLYSEVK